MSARSLDMRPDDGIVIRTPLLPVDVLASWPAGADLAAQRRYLADLLDRVDVAEAIFVASPGLHGAIDSWRVAPDSPAGQRVEHALTKYVARMAWRPTPFGLFAGVSVGRLGRQTAIDLAPRAEYRRRTRLDNDYLFLLAAELERIPAVRDAVLWHPNTSLYRLAGRLRYAEARLDGKERSYHLVSVEPTLCLDATLARAAGGARTEALARALVEDDDDIAPGQAGAFVRELIEQQLLVSDLAVQVTGPEPIDHMMSQLAAAGAGDACAALTDVREAITALDAAGPGNDPARYRAIQARLDALPVRVDPGRMFQVDMVKPAAATLSTGVAREIARTVSALAAAWPAAESASLEEWRRAFVERWEDREVPLAEALDEESGLGFESAVGAGAEGSPLLAGLPLAPAPGSSQVTWTNAETHLLGRLTRALSAGDDEIALADADLVAMQAQVSPDPAVGLPDAFAAMIRIAPSSDGELEFLLTGASGPSGARLLGRFCHASPELRAMVDAHHRVEESLRPGAVFAEIVHLNEGRIGNILCRPVLRDHEIVFLGASGAPRERQLGIDDLLVSVRDRRIVLRSRRLEREVIPRLSTAHNYRLRSLALYRFLCALAEQGSALGSFRWGLLGSAPFLPRVRLGRVILSLATWNLDEHDLRPIRLAARGPVAARRDDVAARVAELRRARRLPRFVALVDGDNELPIDLDNALLVAAFADEVAGLPRVRLTELFPAPGRAIARADDGHYTNEVLLTFTRTRPTGVDAEPRPARRPAARRAYRPGSEWLYAKIYCGVSTADRVLREAVTPVARRLIDDGVASQWFFLRYADPLHHLRVRFAGVPARLAGVAIPALERALSSLPESAVHKLQLDTYVRELERYGGDAGIELVERIFWMDSEAVAEIVDHLEGDAGDEARWRLALCGIDRILAALGMDAEARERTALRARDALAGERRASSQVWARLGDRFARERADLELLLGADPVRPADHPLAPGLAILDRRDARMADPAAGLRERARAGQLTTSVDRIARDLAHMHVNRLLHASQRTQEMVLYDLLRRLHAARRARVDHAATARARPPAGAGARAP